MTIHRVRSSKSWIAPQSSKSCMKIPNNITALSPSGPVIARSAALNSFLIPIICTDTCSDPSEKQSLPKKHSAQNNVLKVLQTWDCRTRILILQAIEYQYARSQWQFHKEDLPKPKPIFLVLSCFLRQIQPYLSIQSQFLQQSSFFL